MSKTIAAPLLAHYGSSATTIAVCWKVTRKDGNSYGYTNLDHDLVVQGRTYSAVVGATATAIVSAANLDIQNVELVGILQQGLVALGAMTEDDILAGRWDDARVTIFECNWMAPEMGTTTIQTGTIGQISTGEVTYTAEVRGLMQALQQNVGHAVLPACWKDVGDANCGVNLALYTFNGTVSTALSTLRWLDTSLGQADHYFRFGKVSWLTGANANLQMEVKDHTVVGDVILQLNMPFPIAVGDTYTISAGCNKLLKREQLTFAAAIGSSVTALSGSGEFTDSSRGEADHIWDGARFTWTSGNNLGIVTEVSSFIGKGFHLLASLPYDIQVGDSYTLEQLISTGNILYDGDCKTKFVLENPAGNAVNHGGFAETPGNDKVLGGGNT